MRWLLSMLLVFSSNWAERKGYGMAEAYASTKDMWGEPVE